MVGDAELALAAASGDRDALASIYDRYADTLYETCRIILRDAHEASATVQDTFVIAATRLGGLRDPERLKPWLCAIARQESVRRASKRARHRPSVGEVLDVPVVDEAAGGLVTNDAANVAWDAVEALSERERTLFVLNVRNGLEGADLADAAGVPGAQASSVLSRAQSQLAVAVRCTLLIRSGRSGCAELAALVPHAHAALDGLTRKRVARHAQMCEHCEPRWNASPDTLGVLAAAPLLAAPAALKNKVLNDPRLISSTRPLGGRGWRRDGFPPAEHRPRRRIVAALAAALIVSVVAVAIVLASDDASPRRVTPLRAGGTTVVTDASTSSVFAALPTSSSTPTSLRTSTSAAKRTTTTANKRTTTTVRPGGVTPTTAAAARVTTTTASVFRITASGPSSMTNCAPARFAATTQGGTSPQLYLHYSTGRTAGSKNMQRSGAGWVGDLSIPTAGPATWWVSTDPYGQGGTSTAHRPIEVTACPQ